jgi:RNA polymerase sigma factor (sigma-70 family)
MSSLPELLVKHRADLLRYVERHAGSLLRFETANDLTQSIHLRALEHGDKFEYRGREPFFGWLHEVARRYMAGRKAHWFALKRHPKGLFRLTEAATTDPGAVVGPAGSATSPSSFAVRRERLTLAVKALDVLMERDRKLVQWSSEGLSTAEQAERLGISESAAERARQRAVERYRKAYRLLRQRL